MEKSKLLVMGTKVIIVSCDSCITKYRASVGQIGTITNVESHLTEFIYTVSYNGNRGSYKHSEITAYTKFAEVLYGKK